MRKFVVRLGLTAILGFALVAPGMAAVTGAEGGEGTVTGTTKEVWTPDNVTQRSVDVIDRVLTNIKGYGKVYGAASRNFYRETTVARTDQASALSSMKAALNNDVYSVGGRTAGYSATQTFLGNSNVKKYLEITRTLDSISSTISSTQTTTSSEDAIIVGDPDALQEAYVAQGNVNQNTDVTITKTKNITETTTTHYDNINYYQINVNRLVSPIVLDLDGDGAIQASGGQWLPHQERFYETRVALFDFYGNGFPLLTEWVGPQDGLLCLPKADGTVDGTCLFGTATGYDNGFDALSVLDANRDTRLQGGELAGLMVWQDLNGNAMVSPGELKSLQELGITSLSLQHKDFAATYTRDGKSMKMVDWWPNVLELRKKNMAAR